MSHDDQFVEFPQLAPTPDTHNTPATQRIMELYGQYTRAMINGRIEQAAALITEVQPLVAAAEERANRLVALHEQSGDLTNKLKSVAQRHPECVTMDQLLQASSDAVDLNTQIEATIAEIDRLKAI